MIAFPQKGRVAPNIAQTLDYASWVWKVSTRADYDVSWYGLIR